jgi:hypothetical protein
MTQQTHSFQAEVVQQLRHFGLEGMGLLGHGNGLKEIQGKTQRLHERCTQPAGDMGAICDISRGAPPLSRPTSDRSS